MSYLSDSGYETALSGSMPDTGPRKQPGALRAATHDEVFAAVWAEAHDLAADTFGQASLFFNPDDKTKANKLMADLEALGPDATAAELRAVCREAIAPDKSDDDDSGGDDGDTP